MPVQAAAVGAQHDRAVVEDSVRNIVVGVDLVLGVLPDLDGLAVDVAVASTLQDCEDLL